MHQKICRQQARDAVAQHEGVTSQKIPHSVKVAALPLQQDFLKVKATSQKQAVMVGIHVVLGPTLLLFSQSQ